MGWTWKDKQEGALPLRYEPGNWGDALKGEWLLLWLRWWISQGHTSLRYRDPFCGSADYPLTEPTRQRLSQAPLPLYREWLNGERLLSSASLIVEECKRQKLTLFAQCSDKEGQPLEELTSDLLLFDPYDFFERWPEWNDALLALGPEQHVVIYLYNKSPRGSSQFRQYQDLTRRWQGRSRLVARVASDALLPRAYHEVWLCGPAVANPVLRNALQQSAQDLARHLSDVGAWEAHL